MSARSSHDRSGRGTRRWRGLLPGLAAVALLGLAVVGGILERSERTPLVAVGQAAPEFTLPSSQGGIGSLVAQLGHPVLLAFVPSVQCGACKEQLRMLERAVPALSSQQIAVFAVSTDEPEVQRAVAKGLDLTYPLLAEDVVIGEHPAGHAYGVFHLRGSQQGPVDANAIFVIDSTGIVRAVDVRPAGQLTSEQLVALTTTALMGDRK